MIGPRLLLAAWNAGKAAVLKRRVPVPGAEDFYVRSLLRNALGRPGLARVVPYGFQHSSAARERLERLGPHRTGVGCVYVKDLDAVDLDVLEDIVETSYRALTAATWTSRAREDPAEG